MDLRNPWIALRKAWINALRGQSMDCARFGQSMDYATFAQSWEFGRLSCMRQCDRFISRERSFLPRGNYKCGVVWRNRSVRGNCCVRRANLVE